METRASYFLVGLFVLMIVTGAFVTVLWLSNIRDRDIGTLYYIYFRGSVTGLQNGAPVRLRGVPVGTVTDIALDDQNIELIQVTVTIRPGTPIKTDTYAQLAIQSFVTGQAFIQLFGGTQAADPLEPRAGRRRAVIPWRPSPLDRLFDDAPELFAQIGQIAVRLNQLLSDENLARISTIIGNVEQLSANVAGASGRLTDTVNGAGTTIAAIGTTANDVSQVARDLHTALARVNARGGLLAGTERTMEELRSTVQAFERVGVQLDQMIAELRRPVHDFVQYNLQDVGQLVAEARTLVASLSRLLLQIQRDPPRFFFGDQQRGFQPR
jgi:phospholipid/cholesterol/gamma-HCH transport system substrate-binding protein